MNDKKGRIVNRPIKRTSAKPKKGLNPQALKRLELVSLLTRAGTPLSNATVGNWIAAGCPRNLNGTLSLVRVCAWLAAERRKKETSPAPKPSPADELARFKLLKLRGQYFTRTEVVAQFEDAATRIKAVLEAVERNHGASVGATIRDAITKAFAGIEETITRADRTD